MQSFKHMYKHCNPIKCAIRPRTSRKRHRYGHKSFLMAALQAFPKHKLSHRDALYVYHSLNLTLSDEQSRPLAPFRFHQIRHDGSSQSSVCRQTWAPASPIEHPRCRVFREPKLHRKVPFRQPGSPLRSATLGSRRTQESRSVLVRHRHTGICSSHALNAARTAEADGFGDDERSHTHLQSLPR